MRGEGVDLELQKGYRSNSLHDNDSYLEMSDNIKKHISLKIIPQMMEMS